MGMNRHIRQDIMRLTRPGRIPLMGCNSHGFELQRVRFFLPFFLARARFSRDGVALVGPVLSLSLSHLLEMAEPQSCETLLYSEGAHGNFD